MNKICSIGAAIMFGLLWVCCNENANSNAPKKENEHLSQAIIDTNKRESLHQKNLPREVQLMFETIAEYDKIAEHSQKKVSGMMVDTSKKILYLWHAGNHKPIKLSVCSLINEGLYTDEKNFYFDSLSSKLIAYNESDRFVQLADNQIICITKASEIDKSISENEKEKLVQKIQKEKMSLINKFGGF
jgi:hypothetical protein